MMIADLEKGIKREMYEFLSGVFQFHCALHQDMNVHKNCGAANLERFFEALYTYTRDKLAQVKAKYTEKGKKYFEKVEDRRQYPSASELSWYGLSTSLGVEGMNESDKRFRRMGMCRSYVKMIRQYACRHLEWAEGVILSVYGTVIHRVMGRIILVASKSMSGRSATVRRLNTDRTIFEVPSSRDHAIK